MSKSRREVLFEVRLPRGYTILDDISNNKIYLDENSKVRIIDCTNSKGDKNHCDIMTVGDARRKYG
jgi:hypothetical protein